MLQRSEPVSVLLWTNQNHVHVAANQLQLQADGFHQCLFHLHACPHTANSEQFSFATCTSTHQSSQSVPDTLHQTAHVQHLRSAATVLLLHFYRWYPGQTLPDRQPFLRSDQTAHDPLPWTGTQTSSYRLHSEFPLQTQPSSWSLRDRLKLPSTSDLRALRWRQLRSLQFSP